MKSLVILLIVLWTSSVVERVSCAKILAIVATPSYSHQIPYRPLWIELSRRGHEIVLVTSDPISGMNSTTFKQIDISCTYSIIHSFDFVKFRLDGNSWLMFVEDYFFDMHHLFAENLYNNTEMRRLYAADSNATFDVVLTELLYTPSSYALAYRFNAPLIGLTSLGLATSNEYVLGGFVLPSHEYTWEMGANTGSNLPFWRRLWNFIILWRFTYIIHRDLVPRQQTIAEHYLQMRLPPLLDILRNASLLFVNQVDALSSARPRLTNMITYSSFHVKENLAPVPQELENFMNGAEEGFVYFSLGSNAKSIHIPMEIKQIFIDVFAKLPYRVVWKYEEDLKEKPANVYFGKWLPQQSILAHPKIKLFVYQGGLQSTEESVHYTVPLLGIPILADQDVQTARMEALGVGKRLDIRTLTRDDLNNAIREIITNKKYKERMIHLRNLVQDIPYNMADNLAWWTEFVIRHKGADHLRSNLAWQPWYQRNDTDVVIFLSIALFVIVSISANMVAKLVVQLHGRLFGPAGRKQKIN